MHIYIIFDAVLYKNYEYTHIYLLVLPLRDWLKVHLTTWLWTGCMHPRAQEDCQKDTPRICISGYCFIDTLLQLSWYVGLLYKFVMFVSHDQYWEWVP